MLGPSIDCRLRDPAWSHSDRRGLLALVPQCNFTSLRSSGNQRASPVRVVKAQEFKPTSYQNEISAEIDLYVHFELDLHYCLTHTAYLRYTRG